MRAVAAQAGAFDTSAGKHPAVVRRSLPVSVAPVSVKHGDGALLQRKPNCACGGGCPSCFDEDHTRNIQTKLRVSNPGDQYEQEADRVAEQVMRVPASNRGDRLELSESAPGVSRYLELSGSHSNDVSPGIFAGLHSSAQELDNSTRAFMESRFGHDFSQVRVHTNVVAAESASAVGASAYTVGRDIVFNAAQYAPQTGAGRALLAHELAHVVQQRSASSSASRLIQRSPEPTPKAPPTRAEPIPPDTAQVGAKAPAGQAIKKVKFWINSFIPDTIAGGMKVTKGKYLGKIFFKGPFSWSDCFLSDSRGFSNEVGASSRLHLEAEADFETGLWSFPVPTSSGTAELDCEDMSVECEKVAKPKAKQLPAAGRAGAAGMKPFSFTASASDPCVTGAPEINLNGTLSIDALKRTISFTGMIEPFPAFEAYVSIDGSIAIKLFTNEIKSGTTAWDLAGDATVQVIAVTTY